jgi:hypothetical protein
VPTEIVRISYSNKLFLMVSQTGKMGTIINVDSQAEMGDEGPTVEAKTLIGQRNDVAMDVYARRIFEAVCAAEGVPLVLSLALSEYTPANLSALIAELKP